MIYGVGTDIVAIARIEDMLARHGERTAAKLLAQLEMEAFRAAANPAAFLAKRFAAKEAFSKAVGTGFKAGVFMKDIGVVNAKSGAPTLALTGGAATRLAMLIPDGHEAVVHLTLTDDHPWAQAFVVIEARPL